MVQVESEREWPRWLPSFGLVVLLHATAWWGFTHFKSDVVPPRPLTVIEVALLAPPPPPQPKITPKQPEPPKPEPRMPRRVKPVVRQLLQAQPVPERVMEQAPEPAPVAVAPTPPAPAAPSAAATTEPVVEAPRFSAAYLNNPPPIYPTMARRRGIEGRVLVRAEVLADGTCNQVELRKTSGYELLDQAALEAVKKWRFVPARKGSQSIAAWVEVPITFKLEN